MKIVHLMIIFIITILFIAPLVSADEIECNRIFNNAKSSYDNGRYKEAADGFRTISQDHRDCSKSSEALFMLGQSMEKLGNEKGAISVYSLLAAYRSDSTWGKRALERIKAFDPSLSRDDINRIASDLTSTQEDAMHVQTTSPAVKALKATKGIEWEAVSLFVVLIGGLITYITSRRRIGKVANFMTDIDSEYASYKMKPKQCESELIILKNRIIVEFKKGKIDSSSYSILDKRIDDYLIELRERIAMDRFEGMPEKLKDKLSRALEDGTISEKDVIAMTEFLKTADMSDKKKEQFEQMIDEWKKVDSGEIKTEKKSFMWGYISKVPFTKNRISWLEIVLGAFMVFVGFAGTSSGDAGAGILLLLAIVMLPGGIYLKKRRQIGIKLSKIAWWIITVLFALLLIGEKNPIAFLAVPLGIIVLYHLKYIHLGAEISVEAQIDAVGKEIKPDKEHNKKKHRSS